MGLIANEEAEIAVQEVTASAQPSQDNASEQKQNPNPDAKPDSKIEQKQDTTTVPNPEAKAPEKNDPIGSVDA